MVNISYISKKSRITKTKVNDYEVLMAKKQ